MARAISNRKILFAALSDGFVLNSRGFSSSAVASSAKGLKEENVVLKTEIKKSGTAISDAPLAPVSWIPDPVTGYYRPANRLKEIDPAELRHIFLKKKE